MIQSMHKAVFAAGLAAAALFSLRAADGQIPISSVPYTISQPGVYTLTRDLTLASGYGITVIASDVVVDLAGHTLTSSGGGTGQVLIDSTGANVRITNGSLVGGQYGIDFQSVVANAAFQFDHLAVRGQSNVGIFVITSPTAGASARLVIEDNLVTGVTATGIFLNGVQNGRIERNLISRCNNGLVLSNGQFNRIAQNVSSSNQGAGINLNNSSNNTLEGNSAVGNGATGFNLTGGGSNNIYSNNRLSGNTGGNVFTSGVSAGGNNAGAANF